MSVEINIKETGMFAFSIEKKPNFNPIVFKVHEGSAEEAAGFEEVKLRGKFKENALVGCSADLSNADNVIMNNNKENERIDDDEVFEIIDDEETKFKKLQHMLNIQTEGFLKARQDLERANNRITFLTDVVNKNAPSTSAGPQKKRLSDEQIAERTRKAKETRNRNRIKKQEEERLKNEAKAPLPPIRPIEVGGGGQKEHKKRFDERQEAKQLMIQQARDDLNVSTSEEEPSVDSNADDDGDDDDNEIAVAVRSISTEEDIRLDTLKKVIEAKNQKIQSLTNEMNDLTNENNKLICKVNQLNDSLEKSENKCAKKIMKIQKLKMKISRKKTDSSMTLKKFISDTFTDLL